MSNVPEGEPTPPIKMRWMNRDWVPVLKRAVAEQPPSKIAGLGLATFLVLYLLNAVPGAPSPIFTKVEALVADHEKKTEERTAAMLRAFRTLCRYNVPQQAQRECE